jgi:tetratricopeptide (TPR) repeat protein
LSTVWRLILVGPADLERSIIDSALRQAGFELAVISHLVDLQQAIMARGVHGVLVTGSRIARESEAFDLSDDLIEPALANGLCVMLLDDGSSPREPTKGVFELKRPLRFPAAAAQVVSILDAQQQEALSRPADFSQGLFRNDLTRAVGARFSGVINLDKAKASGQIHLRSGAVTLVVAGGLTGAEALCVLLGSRSGSYTFDRQQAPQGENSRPLDSLIAEADALELRCAEMLARAPQGALQCDAARLLSRLALMSDEVAWIFRLIDGKRDMKALWTTGGSRAVEGALSLFEDGILAAHHASARQLGQSDPAEALDAFANEPEVPEQLEDDFAWSLAIGGVSGLPESSLKEEGWAAFDRDDWDQLPDLDVGIESALSQAQSFFKTQIPSAMRALETDIEPMLGASRLPSISVTQEFEAPPILDDELLFADDEELPPVVEDFDEPAAQPSTPRSAEPPRDGGFDEALPPVLRDSDLPYVALGSSSYQGADDETTFEPAELEEEHDRLAARARLVKKLRFVLLVAVLGGGAGWTGYKFANKNKAASERAIKWDPTMKLDEVEEKASGDKKEAVLSVDAGPRVQPKKKAKKRRRRRRNRRKARRSPLRTGEFAKRMQGARILRDEGNLQGAIHLIGMALRLKVSAGERSVALSERGEAHYSAGDIGKASADLRKAIGLDGTNSFALKNLGLIEYENFKNGDASARGRARKLLLAYRRVVSRPDAAVARWLSELQ